MNKEDFRLWKHDVENGHDDYWYELRNPSLQYITNKYMEQGLNGRCIRSGNNAMERSS